MSAPSKRGSVVAALGGLGWPLFIGSAACSVFYALVYRGPLHTAWMHRYFANHPILFVETGMFFVGLAALLLKLTDVLGEFRCLGRIALFDPGSACGAAVEDCQRLLDALDSLPSPVRNCWLGNRLYGALEWVDRQGSAANLDDELKYLSDVDAARQQEGYALVRIIIWATPMLGFLGTVAGITQALSDLDPQELARSIQTAMEGLLAGLYVAFDTTALALSFSIGLMFIQFVVDRLETRLLATVDAKASEELSGRFEQIGGNRDPHVESVRRMGEAVIQASEKLVARQTELWQSTINAAHEQWRVLAQTSAEQLLAALEQALDHSLDKHAKQLAEAGQASSEHLQRRWEQWQTLLSDNARMMHVQQVELVRQGEVMTQVLQATGDVIQLEKALNDNLQLLAGAKYFEDTVMSLAAAIHLLNARLDKTPRDARQVELSRSSSQGRAA